MKENFADAYRRGREFYKTVGAFPRPNDDGSFTWVYYDVRLDCAVECAKQPPVKGETRQ